ncbi:MAG: hypothetical protein IJS99_10895 [Synergistaceae bacterium]|nr:hypothetical protein [Synergistaceae bacterium]
MKKFFLALLIFIMISAPVMAMTPEQEKECKFIIHTAAVLASGSAAAMAQAPGADNTALAVIVGGMVWELAEVFDIRISEAKAEIGIIILKHFAGTIAARIASEWILGWIPFLGNTVNAATMAALVEYIGWTTAENFDQYGSGWYNK